MGEWAPFVPPSAALMPLYYLFLLIIAPYPNWDMISRFYMFV